ncbi:MAG: adenosylcobinamide-GDP ribazoletransferase [Caldilinea sp.]|nr:adenosylcobinamide-GDP ribazoletransferase [Caldilinea sp.]MDW8442382.1 adenosylcobinamide-GDP ribazoletransferase [Caldilineaceae bacterium]
MQQFWSAIGFLTTAPTPPHRFVLDRQTLFWFPFVGLGIGATLTALAFLFGALFPPAVTAVLLVGTWAALTGGLHLDGLADCGDGLLAPVARERRLEIMRDSRIGAFGVVTLALTLMLKTAALTTSPIIWPALLLAPMWARWLLLVAMQRPLARSDGMAARMRVALHVHSLALFALPAVILTAVLSSWHWQAAPASVVAILAACGVLRLAERRIGGVTGDVYGAVVEVSEAAFLCVVSLVIG